jgi:hypothetical protein
MNPLLLEQLAQYGIPAVIGGIGAGSAAAAKGQNPLQVLGAAALGTGLGVGLGGAGRYAGQAIEALMPAAPGVTGAAGRAVTQLAGKTAPYVLPMLGAPIVPAVASGVSGVTGKAAQLALGGGLGYKAASAPQQGLPNISSVSDYTKATGQLPTVTNTLGDPNSPFYASMGMAGVQGDVVRNINEKNIQMEYPYISQFKKDDLDRNLYAAQVRQNIATNANLIQSSVGTAQQMGINAGQQLGQALTANYNYA